MRNRVVITGMGIVCSGGSDYRSLTDVLEEGKPCFSKIPYPKLNHLRARFAGMVTEALTLPALAPAQAAALDRFHHLAFVAAGQALAQASRRAPLTRSGRMGVIVGTCSGPMPTIERFYETTATAANVDVESNRFARRYDGCAKALAHAFSIPGLSATVVTACSASLVAIGVASDLIKLGAADIVLVGGSDTLSPTTLAGFDGLKATTEGFCAPFSKPFGLTLGEAAAFLVLENLDHALARSAFINAEIAGFGLSNDAYHCTAPDPTGAGQTLAMGRALADAGLAPEAVTYINAHGTGTEANDKTETKAIKRIFGNLSAAIPVSSTKSMVGHCLGAAGCLETIATIAAREAGVFPPTANFTEAREGCTLDYIPDAGRTWSSEGPVLTNNFAFGGNNASLALYPRFNRADSVPDRSQIAPIVITACGIISPAGIGKEPFVAALSQGGAVSKSFSSQGRVSGRNACVVDNFDMNRIDRRIDTRHMDKSSAFAVAATRLALQESQFFEKAARRGQVGFYLHCATGSTHAEADYIPTLLKQDFHMQQVSSFPYVVPNSISGNVCKALMLTGHNATFCLGHGAGLTGLGLSWYALRCGHVDALLSCSVDELMEGNTVVSDSHGPQAPPPGEGSCVFLLETKTHAQARNATMLGEIISIVSSTDTLELMRPDPTSKNLQSTIEQALLEAKIAPSALGAIAYNTGNYREKEALRALMGSHDFLEIDAANTLGCAPATLPLYNIAYWLLHSSIEPNMSKNYFLAVFSSSFGINCAVVIRKIYSE